MKGGSNFLKKEESKNPPEVVNDGKPSGKNIKSILKPKSASSAASSSSPAPNDNNQTTRAEAVEGDRKKIQFLADTELNKIKFIPEVTSCFFVD